MSVSTPSPKSASLEKPGSKFVDFDEYIEFQLRKTRSGIHHTDLLTSGVVLIAFLLGYLLCFAMLDHWIVPGGLSETVRTVLLAGVGVAGLTWVIVKIALPLYREVNILYAVREIEATYPELKNSLLSWVQLRDAGKPIPPDILKALEKRTALQMNQSDVDQAVDRRMLMKSSYVLLSVVIFICLYTLFSPKKLSNAAWRAFLPTTSVAVSTKTEILQVIPGDYEVLARDHLDVTVELGGVVPEAVTLFFSTSDRRFVDEPLSMQNTGEGLPRFRARLSGPNGEGLLKELTYFVRAGDATSPTYRVRIKQPPSASINEVAYAYPKYMLLDDKVQQGSTIDAWEGVFVTVRAETNMPVKTARLYRTDQDAAVETADLIEMTKLSSEQFEARWRLKFREDGTYANYYFIQVENEAGEVDPQPILHRIRIRPDLHPEVAMLYPTEDLDVPANAVIPVAYEARDPDFRLRRLLLKIEKSGDLLPTVPRLFDGPETASVRGRHALDLKPLKLAAGDQIQIFLEAEDNFEPFDNFPKHITRSSKVTIRIVEPVSPDAAEEFTEKQEEKLREQATPPQQREGEQPRDEQQDMPQDRDASREEAGETAQRNTQSQQPLDESPEQQPAEPAPADQQRGEKEGDRGQAGGEAGQGTEGETEGPPRGAPQQSGERGNGESEMREQAADSGEGTKGEPRQADPNGQQESSDESRPSPQSDDRGSKPGSKRQRAEDDQALRDLLEWSKNRPDPQEPMPPRDPAERGEPRESGESPERGDMPAERPQAQPGSENDDPSAEGTDSKEKGSEGTPGQSGSDPATPETSQPSGKSDQPAEENGGSGADSQSEPGEAGTTKPDSPEKPAMREGETEKTPPQEGMQRASEGEPGKTGTSPESAQTGDQGTPAAANEKGDPSATGTSPDQKPEATPGAQAGDQPTASEESMPGMTRTGEKSPSEQAAERGQEPGKPEASPTGKPDSPADAQPTDGQSPRPDDGTSTQPDPKQQRQPTSDPNQPRLGETQPTENMQSRPAQPGEPATERGPEQGPPEGAPSDKPDPNATPQPGDPSGTPGSKSGDAGKAGQPGAANEAGAEKSPGEPGSGAKPDGGQPENGKSDGAQPDGTASQGEAPGDQQMQPGQQGESPAPGGESPSGKPSSESGAGAGEGMGESGSGSGPGDSADGPPGGGTLGESNPQGAGGTPSGGGSPDASGRPQGESRPTETAPLDPERTNLENQKKAVDLALQKLREEMQRGKSPEDLLEQLGYNEQDLRSFMHRLEERLADPGIDQSPASEAARRQFDTLLKGIDYGGSAGQRTGSERDRPAASGFGAENRPVPPEYRSEDEAFKRRLSRQGSSR